MRHDGAEDHGDAEDDQDGAVATGLLAAGRRGAEFVVGREDLDEDDAEFAGCGADAVAGGAVAGWEDLGGDDVGCCVWSWDDILLLVHFHKEKEQSRKGLQCAGSNGEGKRSEFSAQHTEIEY
jgi:hypothetical protein